MVLFRISSYLNQVRRVRYTIVRYNFQFFQTKVWLEQNKQLDKVSDSQQLSKNIKKGHNGNFCKVIQAYFHRATHHVEFSIWLFTPSKRLGVKALPDLCTCDASFLLEFEKRKKQKPHLIELKKIKWWRYVVSLVTRETLHFEELKKIIFSTQVNRISSSVLWCKVINRNLNEKGKLFGFLDVSRFKAKVMRIF